MSVIYASVAECDKPDNAFWGDVVFYMYVESDEKRGKRVTLGRVNCDYKDRFEVVEKFKKANGFIKPQHIHAHFMLSEYVE